MVLEQSNQGMTMTRTGDNSRAVLVPLPVVDSSDGAEIAGHYHSAELDAEMEIVARGGGVYARFSGMLGRGRMERMAPAGPDVWTLATRRSMDAPAPGDWTVTLAREDGKVSGLMLGCWLARKISYNRL